MSYILDLRGRETHAGVPLIHPTSEHVVLANVFGIIKNISADAALNPWLQKITHSRVLPTNCWRFSFWEKQHRPMGSIEGNTEVDLVLESENSLVFVEVKMEAEASTGTKADPERNQLIRNLDVGFHRAQEENKSFDLIYVTPGLSQPEIVARIQGQTASFPANPAIEPRTVASYLHWSSWGAIGDVLAESYVGKLLSEVEQRFALDLLAYLSHKRLWKNTLPDEALFYQEKLYRTLQRSESPFIAYCEEKAERYQAWRTKPWDRSSLRAYLGGLRAEDKALLKILADASGALQQHTIMEQLPFLKGKTSASLRALKSHVNAGCKQLDRAQILAEGSGSGDYRIHEINRALGGLRDVVIEVSRGFEVPWHLLERAQSDQVPANGRPAPRNQVPGRHRAWYALDQHGQQFIAAFVDAKGSCSCRMYDYETGRYVRRYPNGRGSFRTVFAAILATGTEFTPPFQPDLVSTEKTGLPHELLDAARKNLPH
jgi:hypothetical protein